MTSINGRKIASPAIHAMGHANIHEIIVGLRGTIAAIGPGVNATMLMKVAGIGTAMREKNGAGATGANGVRLQEIH